MNHRTVRGFTTKEFIVTCLVCLLIGLPLYDAVYNSPYRARELSCRAALKQIGRARMTYSEEHGGKAVPDFRALIAALGSRTVLQCPLSGSYTCRLPARLGGSDAVCWDSGPHRPQHSIFLFMNGESRNLLYADGRVVTLGERQFQRLHLQGQSATTHQQSGIIHGQ